MTVATSDPQPEHILTALRSMQRQLNALLPADPNPPLAPSVALPGKNDPCRVIIGRFLRQVVGEGGTFKIQDLIRAVTAATGEEYVEIDRRLRELRQVDWQILSYKSDARLSRNQLKLVKIGQPVDEPGWKWPREHRCTARVRRAVFERDGSKCTICGIADGQPYPDKPTRLARMTVGRVRPGSHGGAYTVTNCKVECANCNEGTQDRYDYGEDLGNAA
jgi:hypothetical protein